MVGIEQQLKSDIDRLAVIVTDLSTQVAVLESLEKRHEQLCPYRVEINRASNNLARIGTLEDDLKKHKDYANKRWEQQSVVQSKVAMLFGSIGVVFTGLVVPFVRDLLGI